MYRIFLAVIALFAFSFLLSQTPRQEPEKRITLPTSKLLFEPVPGWPRPLNSFPATTALSPDQKYLAILNQGWSVAESNFQQSIAILDLATNKLKDFPDPRLRHLQKQTYFYGLAWSRDGHHLYASIASLTDPEGKLPLTDEHGGPGPGAEGDVGNGIAIYSFDAGKLAPERFVPIAPQPIESGKQRAEGLKAAPQGTAPAFPAGISIVESGGSERLLVANDLADNAVLLDVQSGQVIHRFDLSEHDWIPAEYPLKVVVSRDSRRAWVSLWNASKIKELDLETGRVVRSLQLHVSQSDRDEASHPSALLLSPDEKVLYCALANVDAVSVIDMASGKVVQTLSTQLPHEGRPGVYPIALAQSADGKHLYVADAGADAVALFDSNPPTKSGAKGFIPTEWYPTSLSVVKDDLIVTTAKGRGTGPNSQEWNFSEGKIARTNHPYILALVVGSVARLNVSDAERNLTRLTEEVVRSNRLNVVPEAAPWQKNPLRHAIYIIKENRSFDQLFGDIREANGDSSLVMYGEEITPNHHKLARQFGVLDNFYVSGEVSGDGHVWSTAATASDYTEATVPLNYRNAQRTYDYEGTNLEEVVLEHGVPDVNEPGTGYLWANAARHHISYREYGEYIHPLWCDTPSAKTEACPVKTIEKGQALPANVGDPHGSPSPYPWKVPVLARSIATKAELRDHFDPLYAGWNLEYPDQLRADEFLNEFRNFVNARVRRGSGPELPALIILHLPNDHTSGTRPGAPKPEAQVADNDLALGRLVEAVSNSPYWDDTAIFVLEDDAQNGPDHVDAHRSPALVISKFSPQPRPFESNGPQRPYVDSHFYTTVNMVRTIEDLLGLAPMNHNDAQAVPMWTTFSPSASQPPFRADWRNRDNGLIYQVNSLSSPGASISAQMDFSHADAADPKILNQILWRSAKGALPMPQTPNFKHRNQ